MKKDVISKKGSPRKEHDEEARTPLDRAADLGLLNFQGLIFALQIA